MVEAKYAKVEVIKTKEQLNFDGKILVIGASGLVGSRFLEMYEVYFVTPGHFDLDITDAEAVRAYIEREKPDVIINFAAYTSVNGAEGERNKPLERCWQLNVDGVRNILDAIDPEKTRFIQISTDYVFSGLNGPYEIDDKPEDDPDKLTWYGYTKREAERLVSEKLGEKATILRISSPVRKEFTKKPDYLRYPLSKLRKDGRLYPLYTDQTLSITYIDEACESLKRIIEGNLYGVFHASSSDINIPFEIISKYISSAEKHLVELDKGLVSDPRRYPPRGGLSVGKSEEILGMKFSSIDRIIEMLLE